VQLSIHPWLLKKRENVEENSFGGLEKGRRTEAETIEKKETLK